MKQINHTKNKILPYRTVGLVFLIVTFILYGNTIGNRYCLDDAIVITQNKFVQKGCSGLKEIFTTESFTGFFGKEKALVSGARYRPLSIATFALEQELFGKVPAISHFINIVLYLITGWLLFLILQKIIPGEETKKRWIAFISALLFLCHPIHTEVVANIKGRDEILALLLSLLSLGFTFHFLEKSKRIFLFLAAIAFFLALMAKENAFFVLVMLPLFLYAAGCRTWKQYFKPMLYVTISAMVYFYLRYKVTEGLMVATSNELMNNSFLEATEAEKYATIFYTLGMYLKLLIFPHPLTYDYYPYHIALTDWTNIISLLSFFTYMLMAILTITLCRKYTIFSIAIAMYLIPLAPVSNVFFPIGVFMNERFLYISSIGFCLMLGVYLVKAYGLGKKSQYMVYVLLPVLLILYGSKTIDRNRAWFNDYTLFITDVKTSGNSAKSNCSAGGILLESTDTIADNLRKQKILRQSVGYLRKAVAVYPKYADAWLLLGNAYFKLDNTYDSAIYCYTNILVDVPQHQLAIKNLMAVGEKLQDIDRKIMIFEYVLVYDSINPIVNYRLGQLYGKEKNDLDKSIHYFTKAIALKPDFLDAYIDLGVAYGFKREFERSAAILEKAVAINPKDANVLMNLGLTYKFMGDTNKSARCFFKADSLKRLK